MRKGARFRAGKHEADLITEEKSCTLPERVLGDGERPIGDLHPAYVALPLFLKWEWKLGKGNSINGNRKP